MFFWWPSIDLVLRAVEMEERDWRNRYSVGALRFFAGDSGIKYRGLVGAWTISFKFIIITLLLSSDPGLICTLAIADAAFFLLDFTT